MVDTNDKGTENDKDEEMLEAFSLSKGRGRGVAAPPAHHRGRLLRKKGPRSAEEGARSWCRLGLNNQRKQQNNKNKITLWKPKEHCVQFAVVMYEKKKKKRERERRERQTPPCGRQIGTSAPHF